MEESAIHFISAFNPRWRFSCPDKTHEPLLFNMRAQSNLQFTQTHTSIETPSTLSLPNSSLRPPLYHYNLLGIFLINATEEEGNHLYGVTWCVVTKYWIWKRGKREECDEATQINFQHFPAPTINCTRNTYTHSCSLSRSVTRRSSPSRESADYFYLSLSSKKRKTTEASKIARTE